MNAYIPALLLAFALQARAVAPVVDAQPVTVRGASATVIVSCDSASWPTRRDVNRYLKARSFDELDAAWHGMRDDLNRLCRRGADGARVVFYPAERKQYALARR